MSLTQDQLHKLNADLRDGKISQEEYDKIHYTRQKAILDNLLLIKNPNKKIKFRIAMYKQKLNIKMTQEEKAIWKRFCDNFNH
jgi:hypothetical protein